MICKYDEQVQILWLAKSFILTMWYVNVETAKNTMRRLVGFILTMWYVNFLLGIYLAKWFASFILTMWYVNFSISFNVFWDNLVLY